MKEKGRREWKVSGEYLWDDNQNSSDRSPVLSEAVEGRG